jgi:23S rRNA (uracil1939-C5)-methyltransferase
MHKDVVAAVLKMGPPKMVYVSCNPSTLARDLALMASDYRIDCVQPVDLFPHTFHIESVVKLTRIR